MAVKRGRTGHQSKRYDTESNETRKERKKKKKKKEKKEKKRKKKKGKELMSLLRASKNTIMLSKFSRLKE